MNVGLIWIGPTDRAFPEIFLETTRSVGGVSIAMADLLGLVIVVPAVLCLYVLLRQTRFGRSLRSIAAITRVTARSGEAGKLVIATFFLSGFLGGVAPLFSRLVSALSTPLHPLASTKLNQGWQAL